MAIPLIPIIGATLGTIIVSNIKEQQDIEKAKKHGTKLAADKYAPVLNQLENEVKELTDQRKEKLEAIKVQLKDNEKKFKELQKQEEELNRQIEFLITGYEGKMRNLFGGTVYLETDMIELIGRPTKGKTFLDLYSKKTTLLSIFYDKNNIMAATAEAYFKAKDEWEKKIKEIEQKISNIVSQFDEKELKLWKLNYDLETGIVALGVRLFELSELYLDECCKIL